SAGDEPLYRIALLSEPGGLVQTSAGFAVQTEAFVQRGFDTLLVLGDNLIRPSTPGVLEFLRRASLGTRRLSSICTGAIALA
ncbi:GlxA family transcriptional regulator, partial [Pseudomonas fluorescens]